MSWRTELPPVDEDGVLRDVIADGTMRLARRRQRRSLGAGLGVVLLVAALLPSILGRNAHEDVVAGPGPDAARSSEPPPSTTTTSLDSAPPAVVPTSTTTAKRAPAGNPAVSTTVPKVRGNRITPRSLPPIVFSRVAGGSSDLYAVNSDGSHLTQVTATPGVSEGSPSWSRDGTRIVFVRGNDFLGDIIMLEADGTERQLTTNAQDARPSWSPDGTKIVFDGADFRQDGTGRKGIYVMNADGSGLRKIRGENCFDSDPEFSADGTRILFWSSSIDHCSDSGPIGQVDIYTMALDGSAITRLTVTPNNFAPTFSRQGDKIAFTSDRDGPEGSPYDIWVMDADGSMQQALKHSAEDDGEPAWSPTGTQLVYASSPSGSMQSRALRSPASEELQLRVIDSDGAADHLLVTNGSQPDWR
jgi:TolB protein